MDLEAIGADIVDASIQVHRALGPGLLESAYEACLAYELRKRGHVVVTELVLPVAYEGQQIDAGYRIDMLVDDCIIVENKASDSVLPIHAARLLTFMKPRDCRLGYLLNR